MKLQQTFLPAVQCSLWGLKALEMWLDLPCKIRHDCASFFRGLKNTAKFQMFYLFFADFGIEIGLFLLEIRHLPLTIDFYFSRVFLFWQKKTILHLEFRYFRITACCFGVQVGYFEIKTGYFGLKIGYF